MGLYRKVQRMNLRCSQKQVVINLVGDTVRDTRVERFLKRISFRSYDMVIIGHQESGEDRLVEMTRSILSECYQMMTVHKKICFER